MEVKDCFSKEDFDLLYFTLLALSLKMGFVAILEGFEMYLDEEMEKFRKSFIFGSATEEQKRMYLENEDNLSTLIDNLYSCLDILKKQHKPE